MDADEREICEYLKAFRNQYVAAREISKRAGGKWRFRENPSWAVPVLGRLVQKKVVETDGTGHFRLAPPKDKKDKKRWVSPQLKRILEQSGKQFGDVISIEEEEAEGGT
jgi:hypothetical protein